VTVLLHQHVLVVDLELLVWGHVVHLNVLEEEYVECLHQMVVEEHWHVIALGHKYVKVGHVVHLNVLEEEPVECYQMVVEECWHVTVLGYKYVKVGRVVHLLLSVLVFVVQVLLILHVGQNMTVTAPLENIVHHHSQASQAYVYKDSINHFISLKDVEDSNILKPTSYFTLEFHSLAFGIFF